MGGLSVKKLYKEILKQTKDGKIGKDTAVRLVQMAEEDDNREMAIIGMSVIYPDAENLEEFWNQLLCGKDSFGAFPESRKENLYDYQKKIGQKEKVRFITGAYLKDIDEFDCKFFNIAPKDAELMNPSQRMLMENIYHTIEDAGYAQKIKGSSTGVFVGYANDLRVEYADFIDTLNPEMFQYAVTGNLNAIIASRFSFFKDLKGPAVLIDTACSSSLVALHEACNSIMNGECEQAVVSGVKVNLYPIETNKKLGIESSDGMTRPFDKHSDGTGCGEGIASVMIKPLEAASKAHDRIYAVIKGSAVNQDGEGAGITAPNVNAQVEVLKQAWKNAKINPEELDFIEAHGTATQLGDTIEIEALTEAFSQYTGKKQFCGLTAVKSNIGHLYEASGITGIIKAALCLYYKKIPGICNFCTPNQNINFEQSPLYIVDEPVNLKKYGKKCICGVSSFGFSGTNCHIVLEEPPASLPAVEENVEKEEIFTLSAQTKERLLDYIRDFADFILRSDSISLHKICSNVNCYKEQFACRIALLVYTKEELYQKLLGFLHGNFTDDSYSEHKLVYTSKKRYMKKELPISSYHRLCEEAKKVISSPDAERNQKVKTCYLKGAGIQWENYYGNAVQKVSLPLYPFAKEKYWVQPMEYTSGKDEFSYESGEILHPLVEHLVVEIPDMDVYETILEADKQFVLHDHIILGLHVMPGATYFEFASYLGKRYLGTRDIDLENLNFMVPVALQYGEKRRIQTIVKRTEKGIHFTVTSKNEEEQWITHVDCDIKAITEKVHNKIDLEEAKKNFDSEPELVDQNELTKGFIEFKTRWLNFKKIYRKKDYALGVFALDDACVGDLKEYYLHPALMDMGLNVASLTNGERYLPLLFEKVKIFGATPQRFYSVAHFNEKQIGEETITYDVELVDEQGNVFVQVKNYHMKKVHEFKKILGYPEHFSNIRWIECKDLEQVELQETKVQVISLKNSRLLENSIEILKRQNHDVRSTIITNMEQKVFDELADEMERENINRILFAVCPGNEYIPENNEQDKSVLKALFYFTKSFSKTRIKDMKMLLLGFSDFIGMEKNMLLNAYNHAAYTMCKSINQEKYAFQIKCIDIMSIDDMEVAVNQFESIHDVLMFRNGKPYIQQIIKENTECLPMRQNSICDGGIYVITGGTGGLGLEIAKEIARENHVYLVLTARSTVNLEDCEKRAFIESNVKMKRFYQTVSEIKKSGSSVEYFRCNVAYGEEVKKLVQEVKKRYGKINGIFHCAGLPGDGFLFNKEEAAFDKVIIPKINAVVNLRDALKEEPIDFCILFSSIASIMALPGQSDYSAANAFMDSFAAFYQEENFVSINWPAFRDIGMAADRNSSIDTLFKTITVTKAMKALRTVLERKITNIIVGEWNYKEEIFSLVKMEYSKEIYHVLMKQKRQQEKESFRKMQKVVLSGKNSDEYTDTERKVASIWGHVLGYTEINIYDSLYDLGGDSILAVKINNEIDKMFHVHVSVSDIFNYLTVYEFSNFLDEMIGIEVEEENKNFMAAKEKEEYRASPQQERLYITQMIEKDSFAYNIPQALKIDGNLNVKKLYEVINNLVKRHEVLRTTFYLKDEVLMQKIHPEVEITMPVHKVADDEKAIAEAIKDFIRPFDMHNELLLRVELLEISANSYIFLMDIHHILADASTIGILFHDIIALYNGAELAPVRGRYRDYSEWVHEHNESVQVQKQKDYWMNLFQGEIPTLNLRTDYSRPAKQDYSGRVIQFSFGREKALQFKKMVRRYGTTLYAGLLAVYNVVLAKYTGQDDIVVGTPIAGRLSEETQEIAGLFINMLAMKNHPEGDKRFSAFLKEVMEQASLAYANQEYSFEKLVEDLNVRRELGRNPMFDTMFVLQNSNKEIELTNSGTPKIHVELEDIVLEAYPFEHRTAKYDITLEALEREDDIIVYLEYCTVLFKQETMERFIQHLLRVASIVIAQPDIKIDDIEMISEEERFQILNLFNDTDFVYDREKTLIDSFEEQVKRNKNKEAVYFEGKSLTYEMINIKANQLARIIRSKGLKAGEIVGILMERSCEMMVALLAVLKAGGAYMPMDPNYPAERSVFMLKDSKAKLLLTHKEFESTVLFDGTIINVEDKELYEGDGTNLEKINSFRDLVYLIYTSGSTGKPKGVMIEHFSIVNRLGWMQSQYPIGTGDRILQKTPFTFDVSVWELFWWSMTGAEVVFLAPGMEKDPIVIAETIQKKKITTMHFVPSMLSAFLDCIEENKGCYDFHGLRQVFVSGEAISRQQVERFKCLIADIYGTKLYNLYGPTEATVDVSYFDCLQEYDYKSIPIGKPIFNTKLFIVDAKNRLKPIGIAGELCIAGDGLARGYLNREDLTNEKFVPNPFSEKDEKMYHTGDLARWLPDGNIEYLSRMDYQVKIRGVRIELGEIESKLYEFGKEAGKTEIIKETVVIDGTDEEGDKYLCAYFVSDEKISTSTLQQYLGKVLPEYMVPSYFVQLSQLPVTENGKLDRRQLPKPEHQRSRKNDYIAPRNLLEEELCIIWKEVLRQERIGIDDNFFEMGGHSLKAASVSSKIYHRLNVHIELGVLFDKVTIRLLAAYIEAQKKEGYLVIPKAEEAEYYETSSVQKRIYTLQQLEPDSLRYNIASAVIIEGTLDKARIEQTMQQLVDRHESFRTSFEIVGGMIMQRIHKKVHFSIQYQDDLLGEEDAIKKMIQVFDLSKAPLVQVGVVQCQDGRHILVFNMHHIIADGVSLSILGKEFSQLYEGKKLPALEIQYKDYSVWMSQVSRQEILKKQEKYWLERFREKELPVLNLPLDYSRPAMQTFEGETIAYRIDKKVVSGLSQVAMETGTSMYMILLAAYNVLLSKYCGQEDIIVGSPAAGRNHEQLEGIIGMFVNTLAIRNYPVGTKSFHTFLNEVKMNCLAAFENQAYPFEELVNHLTLQGVIKRDLSRNPLFDTMFVMQNMESAEILVNGWKTSIFDLKEKTAKFDLTFTVFEQEDTLQLQLQFCSKLFKKETILRLLEHYGNILRQIPNQLDTCLCDIEMLSKAELKQFTQCNQNKVLVIEKSIHEQFEEMVIRYPGRTAIVGKEKQYTYQEVNEKANQIAWYLHAQKVRENDVVGVIAENTPGMVISILGVLKAGAAYLPIDSAYPMERIEYMLSNSQTSIVLYENSTLGTLAKTGVRLVRVKNILTDVIQTENLENSYDKDRTFYVIYTSGSTGKPKGVAVRERSFINLMSWYQTEFSLGYEDTILLSASISFDLAQKNLYGTLLSGGTLCVMEEKKFDYSAILNWIEREQVTLINCTPSAFQLLLADEMLYPKLSSLKYVILGGEPISLSNMMNWIQSPYYHAEIINSYGPTECTDIASIYRIPNTQISEIENVPLGTAIQNVELYVLDSYKKPCIIGREGELYIGGMGISKGYIKNESETQKRFIENPFQAGEKIYRTGDIVKWSADGLLWYVRRADQQVKVNGYRIELGEIESRILECAEVKEVFAAVITDDLEPYICAYVVSRMQDEKTVKKAILTHISDILPSYMMPQSIVVLDHMPLTPNGKIDRRGLPKPKVEVTSIDKYIPPKGKVEKELCEIWKKLLNVDKVSRNSSFFELGGHSIKANLLGHEIRKRLHVSVPLKEIFKSPVLSSLADYVKNAEKSQYFSISAAEKMETYPVSSAQKRIYILQQMNKERIDYNLPGGVKIRGEATTEKIEKVLNMLAKRHDAFRTYFMMQDEEPVQLISDEVRITLEQYGKIKGDIRQFMQQFVRPFDISQAPLIRVGILEESKDERILLFDMHHIITDGTSMQILIHEFIKLYNGETLPELRLQYKDFAVFEKRMLPLEKKEYIERQKTYWLEKLKDVPVLNMSTDFERPEITCMKGSEYRIILENSQIQEIRKFTKQQEITMNMFCMGAFMFLLSKYSSQEDIAIGMPVEGRNYEDLKDIIGMFVNTLVIRNQITMDTSVETYFNKVKENLLRDLENQEYQFEELVEQLNTPKILNRNPLFDVMFSMVNAQDKWNMQYNTVHSKDGILFLPLEIEQNISKFDISLTVVDTEDRMQFRFAYSTELFTEETISHMAEQYVVLLKNMAANPSLNLSELSLLAEDNKRALEQQIQKMRQPYIVSETLVSMFEKCVALKPDVTAAVSENSSGELVSFTYFQLNQKANILCHYLLENCNIQKNDTVGVMLERGIDIVAAIIGIMKAGCAYMPIDVSYPEKRIQYMMEDSGASYIVTRHQNNAVLSNVHQIILDNIENSSISVENSETRQTPEDAAYVIYTSGSTGTPKGIKISVQAVVNLVQGLKERVYSNYEGTLHVALTAPFIFDASIKQVFPALCLGHTLYIVSEDAKMDGRQLLMFYAKHKIHISDGTPIHLVMMSEQSEQYFKPIAVKEFLIGGDILTRSTVKRFLQKFQENKPFVTNVYGPTECCDVTTMYHIVEKEKMSHAILPVGTPLPNIQVFIVDRLGHVLPEGMIGELCIGGICLSDGYINNDNLTEQKFIELKELKGTRIYKTGDLAKKLSDGTVKVLGRKDNQVKVNGYRIEIEEVETILENHPLITAAAGIVKRNTCQGDYFIVFYTLTAEKKLGEKDLKEYLSNWVPKYMIPYHLILLEQMPVTERGKIDKQALADKNWNFTDQLEKDLHVLPKNRIERELCEIWKDILQITQVGVTDNFFEIGGNSLKAAVLIARMEKEYKAIISFHEFFKAPTIRGLAGFVEKCETSVYHPIEPVKEQEFYALSSAQMRLYILANIAQVGLAYNMPAAVMLEEKLNFERMEYALNEIVKQQESFCTSFVIQGEQPVQRIEKELDFHLEYAEIREEKIKEEIERFVRPFDLKRAPLLRVRLVKIEEEKYMLLVDMHHIISDGVSMSIFVNDFMSLYYGKELQKPDVQYKDFAVWQNEWLSGTGASSGIRNLKEQESYWLNRFQKSVPMLNLPTDFERPAMTSFEGGQVTFEISAEWMKKIRVFVEEKGCTLYMLYLSCYAVLLSKYSGQSEFVIGSPIAGRRHNELENIIGVFVNMLPMKMNLSKKMTVNELIENVKQDALDAYEYQDYQFEVLVDKLGKSGVIQRDISRTPLFDVVFSYQDTRERLSRLENLKVYEYPIENKISKFDLTLYAREEEEAFRFVFEYASKLFRSDTIERMSRHFVYLLEQMVEQPDRKLGELELVSSEEKTYLLAGNIRNAYPADKTLISVFEEVAEWYPDRTAVVYEDVELTYRELNAKANQMAEVLIRHHVKNKDKVALLIDRSAEMVISILAVLKAGAAYVPIDPEYPRSRIEYTLKDCGAKVLLTQTEYREISAFEGKVIDITNPTISDGKKENRRFAAKPEDPAYIIYTSGTTGKPKGAVILHRNIISLMCNKEMDYDFSEQDVWTMFHSYCFDFSVWEMYGALLHGGKLVVVSKMVSRDTKAYLELLKKEKVTVLNQIPVAFYRLAEEELLSEEKELRLRYIIFGGEALKPIKLEKWKKKYPETKLINMYGITETTVHVTYKEITEEEIQKNISVIGKPISTLKAYVMDENLQLLPIGVPGELCVAGAGVSAGYLNRPELTAQKFVRNPYIIGEQIYRSGDLVKLLPDGDLEYLGRIDHQVKIRGHRIELGEIESCLLQSKLVKDIVVIAKEDKKGIQNLCAFYVSNKNITEQEMKEQLAKALPEYMFPTYFVQLDKIPMTAIGKVDRTKLILPENIHTEDDAYEEPKTEIQKQLAHIWEEVLETERIGITDDFFQIGGHSLRATMLASKIRRIFQVEVSLMEIFQKKTILQQEALITQKKKSEYVPIKTTGDMEDGYYPLSSAQKRLYILNQLDDTSYNMPGAFLLSGEVKIPLLEQVFSILVARHEALRTSIEFVDVKPVQKVHREVPFQVEWIGEVKDTVEEAVKRFIKPFVLSEAPLMRVQLFYREGKYYLLLDMHHIISDGVSIGIIMREFLYFYNELCQSDTEEIALDSLPMPRIQYKDFAVWQNDNLHHDDIMKKQKDYWIKRFSGELPQLNFPVDFERPSVQSFEGDSINLFLDMKWKEKIETFAKKQNCTVYMVMLAVYNVLLHKYTGQKDIIVGSPVAGRCHPDLEHVIGVFLNVLPMRNTLSGELSFQEFLSEVKQNTLEAFENQEYQFEELVEALKIPRNLSRNPIFDTMLVLQNEDSIQEEAIVNGVQIRPVEIQSVRAKFDLTLNIFEYTEKIKIQFVYAVKLFKKESIIRLAQGYKKLLQSLLEEPEKKMSGFEVISDVEKEKVICEFNDTEHIYEKQQTLIDLFEEQADKTPDVKALVLGNETLTYRQLEERANQLARMLKEKGLGAEKIAVLSLGRSFTMIVGILAVLKAGGAYLPADPAYPTERLELLLKESNAVMLLTADERKTNPETQYTGVTVINLAKTPERAYSSQRLLRSSRAENPAYVIFTSGTTGIPKGCMIENRSIVNTILWRKQEYQFTREDRILQLFSYCFDGFVTSLFTPLVSGATIVLLEEYDAKDPVKIAEAIADNGVTHFICVPTLFRAICKVMSAEDAVSLRSVTLAGEKVCEKDRECAFQLKENLELINEYGPTESSVAASILRNVQKQDRITIGKPIWNTKILILDSYGNMQPIGVEGELCIAGTGLARGYINNPDENAKRFTENVFGLDGDYQKIYHTGDIAKWNEDGEIEYVGRIDTQVKFMGYRIELSEIEAVLMKMNGIGQSAVTVAENHNGDMRICAYYTAESEISASEFRIYLEQKLPFYMIPSCYRFMKQMPVTNGGKIDKKALPVIEEADSWHEKTEQPESMLERTLADIWCRILGRKQIRIEENFFEMGGQSLSAASMIAEVNKELCITLSLKEIFQAPTVKKMAELISNMEETPYRAIEKADERNSYPLSSAQKRIFILQQMHRDSKSYNISGALEIYGKIELEKLRRTFECIITRHENLRTSFVEESGVMIQKVNPPFHFELEEWKGTEQIEEEYHEFVRPFDLHAKSLFRAAVFRISQERHIIMLDMHHIISDGVSMGILVEEFKELYKGGHLPDLTIQYKDYAVWQEKLIHSELMLVHENYWLDKLAEINFTELPKKTRQDMNEHAGALRELFLEPGLIKKLDVFCIKCKVSRFAALLAVFDVMLYIETQQTDLCVGIPMAGRTHAETKKLIGMFLNVLMIRTKMDVEDSFESFTRKVAEDVLEADVHQDYPFELLDMKVKEQNHFKGNSLFSILVNYVPSVMEEELQLKDCTIKPYPIDEIEVKYEVTLYISEKQNGIRLRMVYNRQCYEDEMIERCLSTMKQLLEMVLNEPDITIRQMYSNVLLSEVTGEGLLDLEDFIF